MIDLPTLLLLTALSDNSLVRIRGINRCPPEDAPAPGQKMTITSKRPVSLPLARQYSWFNIASVTHE
jgi:hypothetical protein